VVDLGKISGLLIRSVVIVLTGAFIGLFYNGISGKGIPIWPQIALQEAKSAFDEGAIFLDARSEEAYIMGHIPGSVNLPYGDFDGVYPQISPLLSKDALLIAYCDGSDCQSSIVLTNRLSTMGYGHVKVFFGGWQAWRTAGYPISQGE